MRRNAPLMKIKSSSPGLRTPALALILLACALPALALYKVVQPDGSVTYTDRPPVETGPSRITPMTRSGGSASPDSGLPLELRQASARYPVILYSADDCPPCDNGRRLLQQRGVPYTEKRIVTEEDAAALDRLVGGRSVPALSIGQQPLRGFSESDWGAYLDAAGYPRTSKLPKGWPVSAATPLTERAAAKPAAEAPASAPAPAPAAEAPQPAPGIRF